MQEERNEKKGDTFVLELNNLILSELPNLRILGEYQEEVGGAIGEIAPIWCLGGRCGAIKIELPPYLVNEEA